MTVNGEYKLKFGYSNDWWLFVATVFNLRMLSKLHMRNTKKDHTFCDDEYNEILHILLVFWMD